MASSKWQVAGVQVASGMGIGGKFFIYYLLLATCLLTLFWPTGRVWAHDPALHPSQILGAIGFDQRLDAQVPLDLAFRDETGRTVMLGDYIRDKPVLLTLGYWECPNLCY